MQEETNAMSELRELSRLLAEAQSEMENPKKTKKGRTGNQEYMYAPLDQLLEIVKPPLNRRGIFLFQQCGQCGERMQIKTVVFYSGIEKVLDTKLYEIESDPKDQGQRETYARRYSIQCAFGLAGETDTDGNTGPKKDRPGKPVPDRRRRMIAKCAKLSMRCIENGMSPGATEGYMKATYGVDSIEQLDDSQIEEFGKYLAEMEEQSRGLGKEKKDVD